MNNLCYCRDAFDSLNSGKDRGLSKIKRDMLSKPMEGIIDTNITEPAFDVANIYVSSTFLGTTTFSSNREEGSPTFH